MVLVFTTVNRIQHFKQKYIHLVISLAQMKIHFVFQNDHTNDSVNVGGLEEVQSNDPAVMKSTSFGSLDSDSEHVQDLHVNVEDPEKHIEGYVSYFVLTKVRIQYS